jgi:hypothetical protein
MISRRQNTPELWSHIILMKNYTGDKTVLKLIIECLGSQHIILPVSDWLVTGSIQQLEVWLFLGKGGLDFLTELFPFDRSRISHNLQYK